MQDAIPRMQMEQALLVRMENTNNDESGMERNHSDRVNCMNRCCSENALNHANQMHFHNSCTLERTERGG